MSLKLKKLFVDGRTDILRPTILGRLGGVDLTREYLQKYN